ncbi:hypothetical protein LINPERHAP1_LOCUS39363 [Linum perenne]
MVSSVRAIPHSVQASRGLSYSWFHIV